MQNVENLDLKCMNKNTHLPNSYILCFAKLPNKTTSSEHNIFENILFFWWKQTWPNVCEMASNPCPVLRSTWKASKWGMASSKAWGSFEWCVNARSYGVPWISEKPCNRCCPKYPVPPTIKTLFPPISRSLWEWREGVLCIELEDCMLDGWRFDKRMGFVGNLQFEETSHVLLLLSLAILSLPVFLAFRNYENGGKGTGTTGTEVASQSKGLCQFRVWIGKFNPEFYFIIIIFFT